MNINEMDENHVGKRVQFTHEHELEFGTINSYDNQFIYVHYDNKPTDLLAHAANEARGIATNPEDLEPTLKCMICGVEFFNEIHAICYACFCENKDYGAEW